MKVALVHDWLTGMRGGEKVLEVLCELFPKADLYTIVYIPGKLSSTIENMKIKKSFIQKLPFAKKIYRRYLPLMPVAVERFDMSGYDIIVSSSHCVAKGVKKDDNSLHICYCHTPMRYVWEMHDEYFGPGSAGFVTRHIFGIFTQYLRKWDVESSKGVDIFIANSENVRNRIRAHYNRDAEVIYPPVDTDFFTPDGRVSDFYLVVSAFAPYKRVDLAIKAFNMLGYPLKVIGTGQDEKRLKMMANSNIEFLGWRDNVELRDYYRQCRALIFPGEEDFGMTPVEAQACGKPVIAFKKGGALESVYEGIGGLFCEKQTVDSLIAVVKKFEMMSFDPVRIRKNVIRFSKTEFRRGIDDFLHLIFSKNSANI